MILFALVSVLWQSLPRIPTSNCTDIYTCRTWYDIVGPALTALIASVYLNIHQNVPLPGLSFRRQLFNIAVIFLVTLLFPEWIFAWALRTFYVAMRKRDELERARALAKELWGGGSFVGDLPFAWRPENRFKFDPEERYTIVHAFFVAMGGLHIYDETGALGPLDIDTTIRLIACGQYVLPSREKMEGLGKSSVMGKSFALFELLAFEYSCMRRIFKGLPMSNFEVMVLAHTLISVISYIPWWYRPMNVDSPERVSIDIVRLDPESSSNPSPSVQRVPGFYRRFPWWQIVFAHVFGNQDALYSLRHLGSVPLFWSADPADIFTKPNSSLRSGDRVQLDAYFKAAYYTLPIIFFFGLMHLLGWEGLTTQSETLLWRVSVLTVASAPCIILIAYLLCAIPIWLHSYDLPMYIMLVTTIPTSIFYTLARIIILIVSCTSVWHLDPGIYRD